jgi:hypothetical protein
MLNTANEARQRAQQGAAAQRLVNELVPNALTAACERGETSARVELDPIKLKPAPGRLGRLGGTSVCEALDESGQPTLALACRKFIALGFNLSSSVSVETQSDEQAVVDRVDQVSLSHLVLDFAAAPNAPAVNSNPILHGVSLPHAAHWRAQAEVQIVVKRMEHAALSLIDVVASRGEMWRRIGWRDLTNAPLNADQFERLATRLRERGFQLTLVDAGTALRVSW